MAATESKSVYRLWHLFRDLIVLSLSVVLPGVVAYLSILWARNQAPLGEVTTIDRWYMHGAVVDGRLIFGETKRINPPRSRTNANSPSQIKELDLRSGDESPAHIDLGSRSMYVLSIGDKVYLADNESLFKVTDGNVEQIGPLPAVQFRRVPTRFFEYEGRITMIGKANHGGYCLRQLVNGEWVDGRRLRLPSPDQVLEENPVALSAAQLSKITKARPDPDDEDSVIISVSQFRAQIAILVARAGGGAAYRFGIPFEDLDEIPSAADPENFFDASSGWRRLPMVAAPIREIYLELDSTGPVVLLIDAANIRGQVYRPDATGAWVQLPGLPFLNGRRQIKIDPIRGDAYLLEQNWAEPWNTVCVQRVEQERVSSPLLTTEGWLDNYLQSRFQMWLGFLLAWLSHYVAVLMIARWFQVGSKPEEVEYDVLIARPASAWKRLAATIVDLCLGLVFVAVFHSIAVSVCGLKLSRAGREQVGHSFLVLEMMLRECFDFSGNTGFGVFTLKRVKAEFVDVTRPLLNNPVYFGLFLPGAALAALTKFVVEAISGTSPGKRLLGLRLVSVTLQPPGFFRSLIRMGSGAMDYAFLATPVPSLFFMSVTRRVQRFGDFLAETIVVNRDSIGASSHFSNPDGEKLVNGQATITQA